MKFLYKAKNQDGAITEGVVDAPSEDVAAKALHEQRLFVLDISKVGVSNLKKGQININIPLFSNRVSLKEKILFTQQLAMMVKAGLPLIDALTALQEQAENKYFNEVITNIITDVKGGKALSESMGKYPKLFPKLYTAIILSGEKSGKLDEVLERLAEQLQKDYDLIAKIKSAVSYPIIVVIALIGIVILMLIFVIPQLKTIFADMGAQLPLITRIILGISDLLVNYWYLWLIIIIGGYLAIHFWAKTPSGNFVWDRAKLRIPLVGPIIKKIYIARFTRTMGTLVASGLPMLDIIATVRAVINNEVYKRAFDKISEDIENGIALSESLKKQHIFPAMIHHLVATGEKSGKLDFVLLSMAQFFDKEVENTTQNLSTMIEPILIIIIGGGVGLVVASVIMPIYSLVNTI